MKAKKSGPIHTSEEETFASNGIVTFSFLTHKDQDPTNIRWRMETNDSGADVKGFLLEGPNIDVIPYERLFCIPAHRDLKKWRVFYYIKHALTSHEPILAALSGKEAINVKVSGIELPNQLKSSKIDLVKKDRSVRKKKEADSYITFEVKIKEKDCSDFLNLMSGNLSDYSVKKRK